MTKEAFFMDKKFYQCIMLALAGAALAVQEEE